MPAELPVILISHGPFAQGALTCAEMLMGKQSNVAVISIQEDSNINDVRAQLAATYHTLNKEHGVLILVDMLGGSPCNLASELVLTYDDIVLFCGFNIPTLLEVFNNRDLPLSAVSKLIEEVFPESCFNVGNILNEQPEQSTEL
ncbi:PTS system mannose-specific IIA component [Raoultella sp. BIGb0138]|uniref:PTS sugar transporter subunit IIA n=1 Tax=Raoultella sp. BIGb0138 TaxID=2485115 RepID=UPI0010534023|nr:PTS sugar transporter subunit IIA [Raoultella sp. BIGb0138]TCW15273.1 PTS system mannose-specific IIA component [Raoultella sp. BIGb0138]